MNRKFILYIACDNDAFTPDATMELSRILEHVADQLIYLNDADLKQPRKIRDINGNEVGQYVLAPD